MRLGLFVDAAFRAEPGEGGTRIWCGDELLGFTSFAAAVGERLGTLVLIAKGTADAAQTPYELPAGVELAPLPYYRSLRDIPALMRAMPATVVGLWRALAKVDAVWISASLIRLTRIGSTLSRGARYWRAIWAPTTVVGVRRAAAR